MDKIVFSEFIRIFFENPLYLKDEKIKCIVFNAFCFIKNVQVDLSYLKKNHVVILKGVVQYDNKDKLKFGGKIALNLRKILVKDKKWELHAVITDTFVKIQDNSLLVDGSIILNNDLQLDFLKNNRCGTPKFFRCFKKINFGSMDIGLIDENNPLSFYIRMIIRSDFLLDIHLIFLPARLFTPGLSNDTILFIHGMSCDKPFVVQIENNWLACLSNSIQFNILGKNNLVQVPVISATVLFNGIVRGRGFTIQNLELDSETNLITAFPQSKFKQSMPNQLLILKIDSESNIEFSCKFNSLVFGKYELFSENGRSKKIFACLNQNKLHFKDKKYTISINGLNHSILHVDKLTIDSFCCFSQVINEKDLILDNFIKFNTQEMIFYVDNETAGLQLNQPVLEILPDTKFLTEFNPENDIEFNEQGEFSISKKGRLSLGQDIHGEGLISINNQDHSGLYVAIDGKITIADFPGLQGLFVFYYDSNLKELSICTEKHFSPFTSIPGANWIEYQLIYPTVSFHVAMDHVGVTIEFKELIIQSKERDINGEPVYIYKSPGYRKNLNRNELLRVSIQNVKDCQDIPDFEFNFLKTAFGNN